MCPPPFFPAPTYFYLSLLSISLFESLLVRSYDLSIVFLRKSLYHVTCDTAQLREVKRTSADSMDSESATPRSSADFGWIFFCVFSLNLYSFRTHYLAALLSPIIPLGFLSSRHEMCLEKEREHADAVALLKDQLQSNQVHQPACKFSFL